MALELPPAKVVLLAVHLAAIADVDGLGSLVQQHPAVLRRDLVLRILLTHLPETTRPNRYVSLVERLATADAIGFTGPASPQELDISSVEGLSDEYAAKKARRLHLLPLSIPEAPFATGDDPVIQFVLRRAYRIDEVAGVSQIPYLVVPFAAHSPGLRTWTVSTVLPLLRRNLEFYPQTQESYGLAQFEALSSHSAVAFLLSETGAHDDNPGSVGRDLRGIIGPWMLGDDRWREVNSKRQSQSDLDLRVVDGPSSRAWEAVLEWFTSQASQNWKVADQAVHEWGGPGDIDLGGWDHPGFQGPRLEYLQRRYARAIRASAYLVPESTLEALEGAYRMAVKAMALRGGEDAADLQQAVADLPALHVPGKVRELATARHAAYIRNDLLSESNPLTASSEAATQLLYYLILSTFLLTRAGLPWSVKRAGDFALLQDERDQKAEAIKFLHHVAAQAPKNNDAYWSRAREELLWLRSWGSDSDPETTSHGVGIFGKLKVEFLETEMLKALLSNTRERPHHLYVSLTTSY